MRKSLLILLSFCCYVATSQNISVDSQTYTPQELIEDILIDSDCISNVLVTNVVGGDFNNTDQSYGYFDATGTTFPFQTGIVLTTGRLNNVQGPNTSLSDDDAPNWNGDSDLENVLQETNTTNATIIEFDFTSVADQISFRYIFASEEYQEGNPNTCNFSDLFGFLIRPATGTAYQNIALVPNTQTPVKVTTVHPDIPGGCGPINEAYFESFNGSVSPINFNGQTTVLTATAQTIPNQNYHVKLVIADEQNFRFDSAVFLEAESFELNTNLGQDRLLANNNPVCGNDTITLSAFQPGMTTYKWFRNNIELITETSATYEVTQEGTYNVEVTLDNSCISYGEIVIEYAPNPIVANTTLFECDINQDGLTTYNLFDSADNITMNNANIGVTNFYSSIMDAQMETNAISNPNNYNNTSILQTVYASVINQNTGCKAIAEVILDISTNTLALQNYNTCDDAIVDGFTTFNLNDIRTTIQSNVPVNSTISFYNTIDDAFTESNIIDGDFENTIQNTQTIFVKVTTDTNQCYAISQLTLNILFTPQLLPDESVLYCLNNFPETITLTGGITNDLPSNHYYQWFFNGVDTGIDTSFIEVNEIGTYTVVVTDPNGCSNTRDITVFPSSDPTIDDLTYTELTSNNSATIMVSGEGDYEFAIDNALGFYQDENIFTGLTPGFHTIYIRDKMGCGSNSITFSILGFPQYFSPNNDTINDTWKPYGTNEQFNSNLKILIFNRHGKLLAEVDSVKGWNGIYNGFVLPSDDYWYIINHPNGKQYKGHFALVR
ncbi:choice-of-anchor L domain-containing protein [uncultured Lacinutrix sp.]|uniref:choice-of-anchor L domain-containing protein n=1 Tax=uncultured Lacinutrix sp. TaxID=574032 RepID=UPI0026201846|nr:choice-of-anchor L domain-containing protein [uncultured Lacinutrix sp.]